MLTLILCVVALPLWIGTAYLLLLTVLSGAPKPVVSGGGRTRFVLVVPAHNEAAGIARTVASLLALRWPAELRRVLVVADNCSDDTADRARAAGAEVLERQDPVNRGKGYALELAFASLLRDADADADADAVVVIDADSTVTSNLLEAFAARLERGEQAMQAFYGVLNPLESWRTRLLTIALAIFHRLRGRGREALGVSCGLRGNGMCFSTRALRLVPHRAFSIVEDVEYGIQLGLAGVRVCYVDEAEVLGEMVSSAQSAQSQRQRWERGRGYAARQYAAPLMRQSLQRRSGLLLDLLFDLLMPPLGTVAVSAALLFVVALLLGFAGLVAAPVALLALLPALIVALHVARGVMLSGLGVEGWKTLFAAPGYIVWKLSLKFRRAPDAKTWVRTDRAAEPPDRGGDPPEDR